MYRLIIISIFHFGITTLSAQKYAPIGEKIMSEWGEKVTPKNVWQEYPRPQFEREKWMNLNGLWDYTIQPKKAVRPSSFQGKTLVPFCVESVLSGVGRSWALRPCGEIYDIHSYQTEVHVPPLSREMASVLGEVSAPLFKGIYGILKCVIGGIKTYQSAEELLRNYQYKFDQVVDMKKNRGLSAAVYTQTTDVEGEVNGPMTYDRKVTKVPVETLREMHSVIYE